MSTPLVSLLIPCHNAAPFLHATLDSALAQTHPATEVILVDDGSSDGSLEIARGYEPRIRVVAGPQRGASAARNLATQLSTGEFIQYLDADDLLLPDAVASRVGALVQTGGDVACGDWLRILPQGDGTWKRGALESGDHRLTAPEPDLAVLKGYWAPPAALTYRKALVARIGSWHPSLPVIQDARFLFDAAFQGGRFVHVPGESAHYRQHASNSLSSRSRERFWGDVLANNREIERLWTESGRMDASRREAIAGSYAMGARVAFTMERGLYRSNLAELQRFPEHPWSRYLRVATALESILGYAMAARLLRVLRPNPS